MNKELAIKLLRGSVLGTNEQQHEAIFMAIRALKAEPIKHGHWIESWGGKWHSCSVCGGIPPFNLMGDDMPTPYCPHCGAKMDLDEVEE